MKTSHRKDYIDGKEFNRLVGGAGMPVPDDDSKDDSAVDENTEIQMGEDYPDSAIEEEQNEEDDEETEQRINRAAGDRYS